jgi:hypothetical protein
MTYFIEATIRKKNHPVVVLRCGECRNIFQAFTVATDRELIEWAAQHKCPERNEGR